MNLDHFYTGQRMSLHLPADVLAHEINDTGGILYWADGTRTSWRRETDRLTGPDWCPWHLADWRLFA